LKEAERIVREGRNVASAAPTACGTISIEMSLRVGLLSVELFLPDAQSLKDKRMVLRAVKDRLKKFNVSVAEVEHQQLWQRAGLGIVSISNGHDLVDKALDAVLDEIERVQPGVVTRAQREWLA
jgi:uncharacterized protein YlxP (DUF503 family)